MTVPYSFGTATSAIPLSQLDSNFNTPITLGNTAIQLGNTVTTLNNMTLANLTVSSVSTAITVAQGGTGLTSTPSNGQIDIGNGTGFTRTTLTAGSNITITNGAGSITIAASSSGGNAATATTLGTVYGSMTTSGASPYLTALGYNAAPSATGINNTAVGHRALITTTTGASNTAIGKDALYNNLDGSNNTAVGYNPLDANTSGSQNTAIGYQALKSNTTAGNNTAVGYQAAYTNSTGSNNTALGYQAGYTMTGNSNCFVGYQAGYSVSTGTYNMFFGRSAGESMTTGSSNVILGRFSGNASGLDIRTSNNYIVLSDGDGNPRGVFDGSGNFGVGTTSPNTKLEAYTASSGAQGLLTLQQADNTVGNSFGIDFRRTTGSSNALRAKIYAYRDGSEATGLTFSYANSGGTVTEGFRLDSSGNFGINNTSPTFKLDVIGTDVCRVKAGSSNATDNPLFVWNNATTGDNRFIFFQTEGTATNRGSITYNRAGGLVAYNTTSDYRAKTVKGSVQNALDKVTALKPCTGRMNDAELDIDFFVAHELQEIVPSAVTGKKDAVNGDGTPNYQMVDKSALIPLLTAAIQEQQAIIEQLKADVAALKGAA